MLVGYSSPPSLYCRPDYVIKAFSLREVELDENIVGRGHPDVTPGRVAKGDAGIWTVDRLSLKRNVIRRNEVRGVKATPSGSVISVVTCDDDSETVGMIFLVVEGKGAGIELVDEVVEDVAVITMPKLQMTDGAEDNVHTHEPTRKTELLNTGKVCKKQGISIIDVKKYLVVIYIVICL